METYQDSERMEVRRTTPNYSVYIEVLSRIISMTTPHTNALLKALHEVEIPNAVCHTRNSSTNPAVSQAYSHPVKIGNDQTSMPTFNKGYSVPLLSPPLDRRPFTLRASFSPFKALVSYLTGVQHGWPRSSFHLTFPGPKEKSKYGSCYPWSA